MPEINKIDYRQLGLRVGLEIHQQLASQTKLFCSCPIKKSDSFPIEMRRRLRPVAGELGQFDPAALYEFVRGRVFAYRLNPESSCLVESDEEPPKPMNMAALRIALQIAKLLDCSAVDEVHVMRKTVIDGSAVSGFQRTALIATNGYVETSFGKVTVQTLMLEEDAATTISRGEGIVEYRLDRQGVPLAEIATAAAMHTPGQVKEAAETIGLLLRSVPVIRGIGSIRQDVNISIENGSRVEIKGFQELGKIEKLVENEVARQLSLLQVKEELERRGGKKDSEKPTDVTTHFRQTESSMLRKIIDSGGKVFAAKLPGFAGLMQLQCGAASFGKELSSYAEAFGLGLIHSDELQKFQFLKKEFALLKKTMAAEERDLVFIVAGRAAERAINAVTERARHCWLGVPEETRVAEGVGSRYTRPLPGAGRLYPETDIPPVFIAKEFEKIEMPRSLLEKKEELAAELTPEMARQILRSRYYGLFEEFRGFGPQMVASVFLSTFTDLRRRGFDISRISKDDIFKAFAAAKQGKVAKNALPQVFERLAGGEAATAVLADFEMLSDSEIRKAVKKAIGENAGKKESVIMGIVMQKLGGKAEGSRVAKIVREEMK